MARKKLWYLKEWRLARGLTLDELAHAVNELTESWGDRAMKLSKSEVSKLERGVRRYNSDQLEAFAKVLKAEPGDIVAYTPQEADDIKRIVGVIIKRGRPIDLRLLRTLAGEEDEDGDKS
jgi:transcriptional regulator with XRE-family HTH domain